MTSQLSKPDTELLRRCFDALKSLPFDALGFATDEASCWPIRDELMRDIDLALKVIPAQQTPIAWRWHWTVGDERGLWTYGHERPTAHTDKMVIEPLYAAPPVPPQESKLRLFLAILSKAGGETSGSDSKWNWVNYFCDDAEPLDTFNQASKRKLTRVTHDSDTDESMVYLTDAGRAFLAADHSQEENATETEVTESLDKAIGWRVTHRSIAQAILAKYDVRAKR